MTEPFQPRPVPWAGVIPRIRATVRGRRLVPTTLALAGTDVLYRLLVRSSRRRGAAASAAMDAVVGESVSQQELAELGVRHVAARARGWELTWRPWELTRIPVRGLEILEQARRQDRGLMLSKSHLGPLAGWVPLGRLLRPLLLPADEWLLDQPNPGFDGYRVEHRRRLFHDNGIHLVPAKNSALVLYQALRRGGSVLLSMDMPGERHCTFLGKPVEMVDGTAQLAARTGALVLPVALLPTGRRWEIEIGRPLDPREFSGPDALHEELLAVHERWIRAAPEHLENPLWRWGRADRTGWYQR